MSRRIIVLGIDGLEYTLVKKWDLKYLKQKAYCKTDLSDFNVIVTPPIWAAMITGKKIKEIENIFLKRARFFSENPESVKSHQKQYFIAKIAAKILPKNIKNFIISNMLPNPFEKTKDILMKKKYTTIFEYFNSSWTNGIPSYGRNVVDKKSKKISKMAIEGKINIMYEYAMQIYEKDKSDLFSALQKNYSLIFWYTPFLDKIEHFFITKKAKLLNIYLELNNLVKKVYNYVNNDDAVYIISDHGMVPMKNRLSGYYGDHSDYGFFSSNTGELIKKPTELYYLIINKL